MKVRMASFQMYYYEIFFSIHFLKVCKQLFIILPNSVILQQPVFMFCSAGNDGNS